MSGFRERSVYPEPPVFFRDLAGVRLGPLFLGALSS